ncbi:VrrA/YqfQ family protein [Bacillus tuaregi]|uniref:VrrA/YqfQ family protein n=1 Tax=Bacillus tuaregi TaxID=1816695 RepID=UPI0008F8C62A|nr:VrrA/YqfQ family protein [Bacillus tuaregi]
MMPRYRFPTRTGMPPHYFNPYGRPPIHPRMGMYPQMQQRGGILSRLLGRGAQTGAAPHRALGAFGPQQAGGGGSFLKALTNPSSLNSMLSNTQKVLSTAQQVGPIVQQYGPIVKNLPTLWKLYRGFKDAPEFNQTEEESNGEQKDIDADMDMDMDIEIESTSAKQEPLPSTPKLYI